MDWLINYFSPGEYLLFTNALLPPAIFFVLMMFIIRSALNLIAISKYPSGMRYAVRIGKDSILGRGGSAIAFIFFLMLLGIGIQADAIADWRVAGQIDNAFPWGRVTFGRALIFYCLIRTAAILAWSKSKKIRTATWISCACFSIGYAWFIETLQKYLPNFF